LRETLPLGRTSRWVYVLPVVHLILCFMSFIGYAIPRLSHLGIIFTFVLLADLPISVPYYVLALGPYSSIGLIWVIAVGTAWWYLLSRGGQALLRRFGHRDYPSAG
jgi:hypothetical protein